MDLWEAAWLALKEELKQVYHYDAGQFKIDYDWDTPAYRVEEELLDRILVFMTRLEDEINQRGVSRLLVSCGCEAVYDRDGIRREVLNICDTHSKGEEIAGTSKVV